MTGVFIDTAHLLALILPRDQHRARALELARTLKRSRLVTSEVVIIEVFDHLAELGEGPRRAAKATFDELRADPSTVIVPLSTELLERGVALYEARPDKGYSLTDCISMLICRDHDISDVLTHDHHFEQEGFVALMRQP